MLVAVPKESAPGERRVALVPDTVRVLARAGFEIAVEAGAGAAAGYDDAGYEAAGARLEADAGQLAAKSDCTLRVQAPSEREIAALDTAGVI